MEADISIWRKPGHFYFALTEVQWKAWKAPTRSLSEGQKVCSARRVQFLNRRQAIALVFRRRPRRRVREARRIEDSGPWPIEERGNVLFASTRQERARETLGVTVRIPAAPPTIST
jgi:hypothetical protein